MLKSNRNSSLSTTTTVLIVAGLFSATASYALLHSGRSSKPVATIQNPVVQKALKQARSHQSKGRWKLSAELLQPYATSTNPTVLLEYAKLLSRGWGVPQDLDKAREKLLLAVQQDFPKRGQAAFELAKVYRQSSGEDCARIAFEWFSKAAAWGFSKAHIELGRHHLRGIAVPVNVQRALSEFQIAAREGSATALLSFLKLVSKNPKLGKSLPPLTNLVSEAIPMLEQEALRGKKLAIQLNNSGAMTEFGRLHLVGSFGLKTEGAVRLFEQGVKAAHPGSMLELAKLHLTGRLVTKDGRRAMALLKRGASLGHSGSQSLLAKLLGEKKSLRIKENNSAQSIMVRPQIRNLKASKKPKNKSNKHPLSGATVITPFGRKG